MRISDWSSDVCSSDLIVEQEIDAAVAGPSHRRHIRGHPDVGLLAFVPVQPETEPAGLRAGQEEEDARVVLRERGVVRPGRQADFEFVPDTQVGDAQHRGHYAVAHPGFALILAAQYFEGRLLVTVLLRSVPLPN